MKKTKIELAREIFKDFSLFGFLTNRLSDRYMYENNPQPLVSYYRPINGRGRDQWLCLKIHLAHWKKTGNTTNYCQSCPQFLEMTCMESMLGTSRECKLGHYRFEAT